MIIVGLILIFSSLFKEKETKNEATYEFSAKQYITEIENKLENFLLTVDGINNVNVIITLDSSSGMNHSNNNSYNILGSSNSTYEIYPSICGVAISCTNGDNDEVKNRINKLVSAYLGISSNRIEIVSIG